MKLDRNIAIVRSMLRSAIDDRDNQGIVRLFGLLLMLYAEHNLELEKAKAKLEFKERRQTYRRVA